MTRDTSLHRLLYGCTKAGLVQNNLHHLPLQTTRFRRSTSDARRLICQIRQQPGYNTTTYCTERAPPLRKT